MPEEYNFADLHNRMTKLETVVDFVRIKITEIANKLENGYATVKYVETLEQRVDKLESVITWISRLIIGLVITALIGLVITNK